MTDSATVTADAAKTATIGFLKALSAECGPGDTAPMLTGALYGVVAALAFLRPKATSPEVFRANVVSSVNSALTQVLPASPVATSREDTTAEGYLRLVADTSCRGVQELAHTIRQMQISAPRGADPADGVISGVLAAATYLSGDWRDKTRYATPGDVEPVVLALLRDAWAELAVFEAADAMGEAQGNG